MPAPPQPSLVVTGFGCVTALGSTADETWKAVCGGQTARAPLTVIPVDGCRVTEGAEVARLPWPTIASGGKPRLSRAARLAIPAAAEALSMAELRGADGGCTIPWLPMSLSTTACGMEMGEAFLRSLWAGENRGQAARVAHYQSQQQVAPLQEHLGFRGPVTTIANACAGGGNAIGHGADMIRAGQADIVLCGGYEALSELVFAGFDCLQSLAPDCCRPFDRKRRGLMLGEGAAFLVLERAAHAAARNAPVFARFAGYGHATDTHHLTQPDPEGAPLERAMRMALERAGCDAGIVGYVNAHGTGTPFNDGAEAKAFHRVFTTGETRLSSTKAAIGHTLGAAGAVEAVLAVLAMRTGRLPPQINLQDPEPLVAEALVQPGETADIRAAMSVNLGFGGSTASILFTRA